MAKQISQETFDGVVRENMEEFEMSAEEAIEDAVSQFEAQGINLANIVKDLCLQSGGEGGIPHKHPVIEAIEVLSEALNSKSPDEALIKSNLDKFKTECDIDLAHRCLAAKSDAYPMILKAVEIYNDNSEMLANVIEAFCALCNGQPDILNPHGRRLLQDTLKKQNGNASTATAIVKLIRLTCIMHEQNRQDYVAGDIIPLLMSTLEAHPTSAEVVREVCFTLRVLTFDDDPRVPFGKSHDHAKMIVTEADALRKIINIAKDYSSDKAVLGELFSTLARLAVRNEFCQEIMDHGGLDLILEALSKNMEHKGIAIQAMRMMKAIAGNDQVKVSIAKAGGVELILATMSKHTRNAGLCETACAALATVALRNPDHCALIVENNGAEVMVKAMQLHPAEDKTQKQACMAIRNCVARTRQHCPAFLEEGAEAAIQAVLRTHPSCHDEAKAALRDLGCKVELQERWKGEGRGLQA